MGAGVLYKVAVANGNGHLVDAAVLKTQRLWGGPNPVVVADIKVLGQLMSRPYGSWTTSVTS